MTNLFKKLNFKDHKAIVSINSPKSFDNELSEMEGFTMVYKALEEVQTIEFVLCFATKQAEVDAFIEAIYDKLEGDAILWMCYPKGSSKNYQCDFNRDTGWAILGQKDLETVRQVAIDDDWSALRFRKVEFIKAITRRESHALTGEAKKRTSQKGV
jgi:hypothetical protein